MNKILAIIFAIATGLYLIGGPLPDPIPFIDEGVALAIFLKCLSSLGLDLRRFVGMKPKKPDPKESTIDV